MKWKQKKKKKELTSDWFLKGLPWDYQEKNNKKPEEKGKETFFDELL